MSLFLSPSATIESRLQERAATGGALAFHGKDRLLRRLPPSADRTLLRLPASAAMPLHEPLLAVGTAAFSALEANRIQGNPQVHV
jgi:hypothetical protein